jgi:hypothetical protein
MISSKVALRRLQQSQSSKTRSNGIFAILLSSRFSLRKSRRRSLIAGFPTILRSLHWSKRCRTPGPSRKDASGLQATERNLDLRQILHCDPLKFWICRPANQSLDMSNRSSLRSRPLKRKLKSAEQRLMLKKRCLEATKLRILLQRLCRGPLTRGNTGGSVTNGDFSTETKLAG